MTKVLAILLLVFINLFYSGSKNVPVNIHRITNQNEFDFRYQMRETMYPRENTDRPWSNLSLVPDERMDECHAYYDSWMGNGLAAESGTRIGWKRVVYYDYNACDDRFDIFTYDQTYSVLISDNPMMGYPQYKDFSKEVDHVTAMGLSVWENKSISYWMKEKDVKTDLNFYFDSFKVGDYYVFIQTLFVGDEDSQIRFEWIDEVANELKTVLE